MFVSTVFCQYWRTKHLLLERTDAYLPSRLKTSERTGQAPNRLAYRRKLRPLPHCCLYRGKNWWHRGNIHSKISHCPDRKLRTEFLQCWNWHWNNWFVLQTGHNLNQVPCKWPVKKKKTGFIFQNKIDSQFGLNDVKVIGWNGKRKVR